jgi:hypothetical protein
VILRKETKSALQQQMDIGGYLMNVKKKELTKININVNSLMEIGNVSVVDLMNHVVKEMNLEI